MHKCIRNCKLYDTSGMLVSYEKDKDYKELQLSKEKIKDFFVIVEKPKVGRPSKEVTEAKKLIEENASNTEEK